MYIHIKREISVELYVSMNMSKHLRSILTQLRSSTLPLEIETREQKEFKQCNLNVIENEQHFLFDCPKYITFRTTLHNRLQEANSDEIYGITIFFM